MATLTFRILVLGLVLVGSTCIWLVVNGDVTAALLGQAFLLAAATWVLVRPPTWVRAT